MNIDQLWQALNEGKTVYWTNKSYKVYIEASNQYNTNHFSTRDNTTLSVRFISTYFGSILDINDLTSLFIE